MTKKRQRYVRIPAYTFDELSDRAKDRVRDWLWQSGWWDTIYADFVLVARAFGFEIEVKKRSALQKWTELSIWHTGNCYYTAGFNATWQLLNATQCVKKLKEHLNDDALEKLAASLEAEIAKFAIAGLELIIREGDAYALIKGNEHGVLSDVNLEWHTTPGWPDLDIPQTEAACALASAVEQTAKTLARWLGKQLEAEETYIRSDDWVRETCEANDYLFDEDGGILDYRTPSGV